MLTQYEWQLDLGDLELTAHKLLAIIYCRHIHQFRNALPHCISDEVSSVGSRLETVAAVRCHFTLAATEETEGATNATVSSDHLYSITYFHIQRHINEFNSLSDKEAAKQMGKQTTEPIHWRPNTKITTVKHVCICVCLHMYMSVCLRASGSAHKRCA